MRDAIREQYDVKRVRPNDLSLSWQVKNGHVGGMHLWERNGDRYTSHTANISYPLITPTDLPEGVPLIGKHPEDNEYINAMGDDFTPEDVMDDNENDDSLGFDDVVNSGGKYISLSPGEDAEFVVADIRKDYDAKFQLSKREFAIEIETAEGKLLTVNAWSLWTQIQQAYREANNEGYLDDFAGMQFHLFNGEEDGDYTVEWQTAELDEYRTVEQDD